MKYQLTKFYKEI